MRKKRALKIKQKILNLLTLNIRHQHFHVNDIFLSVSGGGSVHTAGPPEGQQTGPAAEDHGPQTPDQGHREPGG